VQTIIPLDDGSGLRLTTALYYLPSGRSIQERRIQPDIWEEPYTEAEVAALREVEEEKSFGEEDLEGHFKAEGEQPEEEPVLGPEEEFVRRMPFDRQLNRAVDLLKSWTVFSKLQVRGGS
jgi:carboxyl-terminal processing protease